MSLRFPVYLDTNAFMDIYATLYDGLVMLEREEFKEYESSVDSYTGKGALSAKIPFTMKIATGLNAELKQEERGESITESNKTHTYGSLFNKMLKQLKENEQVVTLHNFDDLETIGKSGFLEVEGVVSLNPAISGFKTIHRGLDFLETMTIYSSELEGKKKKQQSATFQGIKKIIDKTIKSMEISGITLVKIEPSRAKDVTIILSLFDRYLRDSSYYELLGGEYTALIKPIRLYPAGEKYNLLENTDVKVSAKNIEKHFGEFFANLDKDTFDLDEFEINIDGPIIKAIPIAIYV